MADDKPDDNADNPLLAECQARYKAARDHASKWREQAREEFRFYAGEQWDEKDIAKLEEQQRPVVTFNRIMRLVNAVIGHEANNRAEVRYIPRTLGDAKVNELLTNASQYFRDQCDAEFEESDAFRDTIICGMGWTNDRLTDERNPEYDLIEERVDPLEMLWDPASKKPNLADSRYLFRRKRYTEKEIKQIWPDFDGPFLDAFDDETDDFGEPHDATPRNAYQDGNSGKDVKPDVLVIEYQYKERKAFYRITEHNDETGQPSSFDLPVDDNDDLIKKLKDKSVPMTLVRRTVTRRCFVIGHSIVQQDEPVPVDFTYHCITGFRDREKNHWFGIVRMLKDPQRWSNKWLAQLMHIINANAKGGLMAEESAVPTVGGKDGLESSWADPAAITWFNDGALKNAQVQPKPAPTYPAGVDRLLEYANSSFTDVSGVNQELLGLADRDQPGVLEWQRKQSAVTLLAPLFDSLRRFRKIQGRVWLYMMQRYVSDGRVVRIMQDVPGQPSMEQNIPFELPAEWKKPETAQFDVIVDQGSSAPNQKEQDWSVIQALAPVAKEMFMQPSIMLWALERSPLSPSAVEDLKKIAAAEAQKPPQPDPEMMKAQAQIQAKQQEAQMRQQEAQANMQLEMEKAKLEAEIELAKARQEMEIERMKAQNQMEIEQQKLGAQQQQMQMQMGMDRERAEFDAGLEREKADREGAMEFQRMDREEQMARRKMDMETEAHGVKMEMAGGKDAGGRGPITRLFEGVQEGNKAGSEALAKALSQLADVMSADVEVVRDAKTGRAMGTRRKRN